MGVKGSCRAGETAPWLCGLGHLRLGLPFLRGKEVREGAMGGEMEFLLPWKHVSEGDILIWMFVSYSGGFPQYSHCVFENPAEELKMHFYFDFASEYQNIHFLLM